MQRGGTPEGGTTDARGTQQPVLPWVAFWRGLTDALDVVTPVRCLLEYASPNPSSE